MIKEPQQVLLTLKTGNLQQTDTASNMFPVYQTHYNTTDRTSAFKVKFSMNKKKRIHHQVTLNPLVIYCLTTVTHRQDYSSVSHFSVFNNNTAPSLRATLPRHCH